MYIDSLSSCLRSVLVGCYVNGACCNHLIYADDTVLLAPSPSALQKLIDICCSFAVEHDLIFNAKKTKLICIKPSKLKFLYVPGVYLNGTRVTAVNQECYLGFIINEQFTDDDHIKKETRMLYAHGN